jgi:citrate synthase
LNVLITAREAVRRLGVKPATLYAYVSRGLVRSAAVVGARERRYHAEDVERLRRLRRSGRRSGAPPAAFDAYAPVLDSALCLVEGGRLYYRGIDAGSLAERAGLEAVARLLWGVDPASVDPFADVRRLRERGAWLRALPAPSAPIERARAALAALAAEDVAAVDTAPAAVMRTGARVVAALAAAVTGSPLADAAIHEHLARAWRLDRRGADLVRRCLVLVADHELNASTYVARCVASTGATPYAVVIAALSALSGPRHGGATGRAEAMIRALAAERDVDAALAERLRRAEEMPGFGHPLYPDGDPRAVAILERLRAGGARRRGSATARVEAAIRRVVARPPNVDFALALAAADLGLPPGAALGLFLIGRSVGWIGHAIEQYATGTLIRPRARYVGVLPVGDDAP